MSLSSAPAPSTAHLGNTPPQRLDTNQQVLPLPYFFGSHWFALTWCVRQPYNITIIPATGGGKSAKAGGSQKKYACDVAGLVACGQGDNLAAIEVNGENVWEGGIMRGTAHPEHTGDITVDGVGTFRLHWGTETASGDWLVLGSIPEEHPYYRGQIVLECKQLVSSGGGSVPNVRVLVERAPVVAGMDGDRTREGANPITGLVEYLENDFYGLGLVGVVDHSKASALANRLKSEYRDVNLPGGNSYGYRAKMRYISAYIEDRQSFGVFAAAVCENFFGWMRAAGGMLEVGKFGTTGYPSNEPLVCTTVTLDDLVEDPELSALGLDDQSVISDAIVTGPDRDWGFQDSSQTGSLIDVRDRLHETRMQTFSRRFLITAYQQKEQAQELARFYSVPAGSDRIMVKREKAQYAIFPGDYVRLIYPPAGCDMYFRVTRRSEPSTGGTIALDLSRERQFNGFGGTLDVGYLAAPSAAPALPPPAVVTAGSTRLLQVSSSWAGTQSPALLPLVVRPSASSLGYRVHYSIDGSSYDELAETQSWALGGMLPAAVTAVSATMTAALAGPDIALLATQSAAAQADDTLLLAVGDEVMSVGAVTALGGGQYELAVLRGRRGSVAAAHAAATAVHVVRRAECELLQHADFPRTAETRYLKIQPYSPAGELELSECDAIAYVFSATPDPPLVLTFTLSASGPLDSGGNPIAPPAGASGWLEDRAGRYVPYYSSAA